MEPSLLEGTLQIFPVKPINDITTILLAPTNTTMYPNGGSQDRTFQGQQADQHAAYPLVQHISYRALAQSSRKYKLFRCGLKKTAPVYAQNSVIH